MYRICFDYGHGGSDPGAVYKGRREADDNLRLGMDVAERLREYGIIVDETRTYDKTMSLKERSDFEKKGTYDYFVSFHRNAFKPEQAQGTEVFTYIMQTKEAKALAENIQRELVKIGFVNRGVKKADFHVLRETRTHAVLMEVGFIDNSRDNKIFDERYWDIVEGISKAILATLNIPPEKPNQIFYRVMAGSYRERENAERQIQALKKAGFEACLMIFKD